MFGWLRRKNETLSPESRWVVKLTDGFIEVTDDKGDLKSLAKDAFRGLAIETNDTALGVRMFGGSYSTNPIVWLARFLKARQANLKRSIIS